MCVLLLSLCVCVFCAQLHFQSNNYRLLGSPLLIFRVVEALFIVVCMQGSLHICYGASFINRTGITGSSSPLRFSRCFLGLCSLTQLFPPSPYLANTLKTSTSIAVHEDLSLFSFLSFLLSLYLSLSLSLSLTRHALKSNWQLHVHT